MKLRMPLLFIAVFGSCALLAAEPGQADRWSEFRSLYDAGRTEEAASFLERNPPEQPNRSPEYFFNLGTSYYRLGQFGKAVAYLEKAHSIRPDDPDTRKNLELARSKLARVLGSEERLDPAASWIEKYSELAARPEIRAASGVFWLVLLVRAWREYLRSNRSLHALLKSPGGSMTFVALFLLAGLALAGTLPSGRSAAICLERVTIRSGPGSGFLEMGAAEVGVKLRVLGPSAQSANSPPDTPAVWRQVRYAHDSVGWVPDSSLLML